MKYSQKFSEVYDDIYYNKNYSRECDFIISKCGINKDILDVGCGTGKHAHILAERSKRVTGIDISKAMIEIAKKNYNDKNVIFKNESFKAYIEKINNLEQHDAVVSLFNVVNHMPSLISLMEFFNCMSKALKSKGIVVFDCWNSIACAIDPPYE